MPQVRLSPKVAAIAAAVALLALVAVGFYYARAAAAHDRAQAQINQTHTAEVAKQHDTQLRLEPRLPEVYAFHTVPGGKSVTPEFSYSVTKSVQTKGQEAVIAEQASGQVIVDQADSSIMPDAFKCHWQSPCSPLVTDAAGDTIYQSAENNSFYFYYGLTKGKSIIRITTRKALANRDLLAVANSFKIATPAERKHLKVDIVK